MTDGWISDLIAGGADYRDVGRVQQEQDEAICAALQAFDQRWAEWFPSWLDAEAQREALEEAAEWHSEL